MPATTSLWAWDEKPGRLPGSPRANAGSTRGLAGAGVHRTAQAALHLSLPGSHRTSRPIPGTFARLERVYRGASDPLVRSVVVGAMGDLVERQEALAFLERVAAQESSLAGRALAALLTMGDQGRAVLKRLHETGAVQHPAAKMDLATLAKHDFRLP